MKTNEIAVQIIISAVGSLVTVIIMMVLEYRFPGAGRNLAIRFLGSLFAVLALAGMLLYRYTITGSARERAYRERIVYAHVPFFYLSSPGADNSISED